jgi:hypothetical protein
LIQNGVEFKGNLELPTEDEFATMESRQAFGEPKALEYGVSGKEIRNLED